MTRQTIHQRTCDRCGHAEEENAHRPWGCVVVDGPAPDSFRLGEALTAALGKGNQNTPGAGTSDICPKCYELLEQWWYLGSGKPVPIRSSKVVAPVVSHD